MNAALRHSLIALLLTVAMLAGAEPLDGDFAYQGRLGQGGEPVDGQVDLTFKLFDAAVGGAQRGAPLSRENVTVADGVFTVLLDFGVGAFDGDKLWIEVQVRNPAGTGDFTPLAPRQPVTPTPYAFQALSPDGHSLDTADGDPQDVLVVDPDGHIGIGEVSTDSNLNIQSDGANPTILNAEQADGTDVFQVRQDGDVDVSVGDLRVVSGNVGIHQINPSTDLNIRNNAANTLLLNAEQADGTDVFQVHQSGDVEVNEGDLQVSNGGVVVRTGDVERPLTIVGSGADTEWISLKDNAGFTTWHLNYLNDGLNFAEFGVTDGRLFLEPGQKVGINNTEPDSALHIIGGENNGSVGALKITTSAQNMILDGDEIDTIGNSLKLQENSSQDVRIGGGGGDVIIAPGAGNAGVGAVSPDTDFLVFNQTGNTLILACAQDDGTGVFEVQNDGDIVGCGISCPSDERLKKNVEPIADSLDKVLELRGVTFEWREESPWAHPEGANLGFIAQDLEAVVPDVVKEDNHGYKTVNYTALVPLLAEAIKEQHARTGATMREKDLAMERLENENAELRARMERLEAAVGRLTAGRP